jgi:hypothetical protein
MLKILLLKDQNSSNKRKYKIKQFQFQIYGLLEEISVKNCFPNKNFQQF